MDAWYLYSNAVNIYTHTTAATAGGGLARYVLTGNPTTLKYAGKMASFAIRAHGRALAGVLRTPLVSGGSATLGSALVRASGAVGAGYALGAGIGIAASELLFDDASRAIELYKNPKTFYTKALKPSAIKKNVGTIISSIF